MSVIDILWLIFCIVTIFYVLYALIRPERFD